MDTPQVIGWIGTGLLLLAYLLVSAKKVDSQSLWYQILNLVGAIGLGVNVLVQRAWPAVFLELVWAGIAVWTLVKKRKRPRCLTT